MVVRLEVSLNLKLIVEIPVGKPGVDVGLFGRTTTNLLVMVIDVVDMFMINVSF